MSEILNYNYERKSISGILEGMAGLDTYMVGFHIYLDCQISNTLDNKQNKAIKEQGAQERKIGHF